MGKRKEKPKKLNVKNPKQLEVINLFAMSEGRVNKSDILTIGNKEIFYRMLNQGYIKETIKGSGVFKSTNKLKAFTKELTGKGYSNGCSNKHSEIMSRTVINVIPNSVLKDGRYTGQNDIKSKMESFKKSPQYHQKLKILKDSIHREYRDCNNRYSSSVSYQQRFDARRDMEVAAMKRAVIDSENPCFTPDLEIILTRDEAQELLENIRDIEDSADGREYNLMIHNQEVLENLLLSSEQSFEIGCEIITENYGNEELFRHYVYTALTGEEVLYFC